MSVKVYLQHFRKPCHGQAYRGQDGVFPRISGLPLVALRDVRGGHALVTRVAMQPSVWSQRVQLPLIDRRAIETVKRFRVRLLVNSATSIIRNLASQGLSFSPEFVREHQSG